MAKTSPGWIVGTSLQLDAVELDRWSRQRCPAHTSPRYQCHSSGVGIEPVDATNPSTLVHDPPNPPTDPGRITTDPSRTEWRSPTQRGRRPSSQPGQDR